MPINGISGTALNTNIVAKALGAALVIAIAAAAAVSLRCQALNRSHASRYDVRSYGARGDGLSKDTAALQAAIEAAASRSGGTVIFPPGRYLTGTLHLRSNVSLLLEAGATLVASRDDVDFDPYERLAGGSYSTARPTWIVLPQMRRPLAARAAASRQSLATTIDDPDTSFGHYAVIAGDRVSNVSIEGAGTIDGNRNRRGGPKLISLKDCRHVTIRGITLRNAANYNISLIGTEDADLEDLTILNGYADGIDPDNSRFVRIANCYIDTRDDAICAKASLALGRRLATEDLVVTNCILRTSNSGFKLGTESEGDFRSIAFSNSVVARRALGRAPITGVAIESVDGGEISGIEVSNIVIRGARTPIFMRLGNRGRGMRVRIPGSIGDISFSNIIALDAARPCSFDGLPGYPIRRVTVADVDVEEIGGDRFDDLAVPELPQAYPQGEMFGPLPAYALYARHVDGLTVSNWRNRWERADMRPAAVFDDVRDLQVFGFAAHGSAGRAPLILMHNVSDARLQSLSAGKPSAPLLETRGADTRNVEVVTDHGACSGGSVEAFDRSPGAPLGGSRLAGRDATHAGHARKSADGVRAQPHLGS